MNLNVVNRASTAIGLLVGLLSGAAPSAAQTAYDKIEVGTKLDAKGIALGLFSKPIPLPEGEWEVLSLREESLPLSGGRSESPTSTPRVFLTQRKLDRQDSPLFAMALHFTPNSIPINWGNQPCTTNNPLGLVDDFGVNASAMLYVCARSDAVYNFRNIVAEAPNGPNNWEKATLAGLAPFVNDIPTNVVYVNVYGNKFRGKSMGMTFMLRADANADVNAAYRTHLKTWMHDTGTRWMQVLNNEATTLPGPATYWASK
jgi:hypothetical protein